MKKQEYSGAEYFYDSVTGRLLFNGPMNRTHQEFVLESEELGYLSFRDDEVNWNTVKIVENGKVVSVDGTFLGYVAPDQMGNRYAINLSAVSG